MTSPSPTTSSRGATTAGAADRAHTRFIVSDDPDEVVEKVGFCVDPGFGELVLHFPGDDQTRALDQFAADALPRMRDRWSRAR